MPRASRESQQASPRRMRWIGAVVAVGVVLLGAWLVVAPPGFPIDEEPAETAAPVAVALPVLEGDIRTLADLASIEDDFSRNAALYALTGDAPRGHVSRNGSQRSTRYRRSDAPPFRRCARALYPIRGAGSRSGTSTRVAGRDRLGFVAGRHLPDLGTKLDPDAAAARAATLLPSANAAASRALLGLDLSRAELRAIVARLDALDALDEELGTRERFHRRPTSSPGFNSPPGSVGPGSRGTSTFSRRSKRGEPTRDRAAARMMPGVVDHDVPLAERLFDSIETPAQQAVAAQVLYRYFTDIDPRQRKAERYRKYLPPEDDGASDDEEDS